MSKRKKILTVGLIFGAIGVIALLRVFASVGDLFLAEAEDATLSGCAQVVTDTSASAGKALQFGTATSCSPPTTPTSGAVLPINYALSSLTGTVRYIAPNGNDTSGNGSATAPYASITKAVAVSASGDTIVARGGTYRSQGNLKVFKTIRLIAYPGETPVFNGAKQVTSGWITEGEFRYVPYTPRPATDAVCATTVNQCVSGDGVGKYPDQAWVGSTQLKQVLQKTALVDGKFYVDLTNQRLYMTATNVAQGGVEITEMNDFLHLFSPNTKLEGFRVTRYSNTANDYGVFTFEPGADSSLMKNVEVTEVAFEALFYAGGADKNTAATVENVTLARSNFMGIGLSYTDDFTLKASKITDMNFNGEFTSSPVSGAIKTARTYRTRITDNVITNNKSHAIWFDVSNSDAVIANNIITGNSNTGVFYEISDKLLLINNYIVSTGGAQPVKIAGSSGVNIVNNTLIGGTDPIGVYTDDRSIIGCSDPANPPCGSWGHLRDTQRPLPATMDWIPRIDLMINNIVAYPTSSGYCGVQVTVCFTQRNTNAYVPIEWTIHKADSLRPQTLINGNVYANGTGNIVAINEPRGLYTTTSAFATAMAGLPVGIAGFETAGKYGNTYVSPDGTPTAVLAPLHGQAVPIPTNSAMNLFIPAGTRHYGVTYR